MLHPSIESINSPVVIVERPAALSQQAAAGSLRESAIAVASQTREEERSSAVCAAGWAY
jgi:hypothetical protein